MRPGFADPVLDAQASFRAILEAMSRPGCLQRLEAAPSPPAPLAPATAAALLTLVDAETPLFTDIGGEAAEWIRFHCGCPFVPQPGQAAFALVVGTPPSLSALPAGSDEDPQAGATLIWQVAALRADAGWRLSGPGIEREHRLEVHDAPASFVGEWAKMGRGFPRGVDAILCAGRDLAALPRTLRIREG